VSLADYYRGLADMLDEAEVIRRKHTVMDEQGNEHVETGDMTDAELRVWNLYLACQQQEPEAQP